MALSTIGVSVSDAVWIEGLTVLPDTDVGGEWSSAGVRNSWIGSCGTLSA